jgi:hypothetical protein
MALPLIGSLASCRLSFLSDRWHPAGSSSDGTLVSRPAVFIFSSCRTSVVCVLRTQKTNSPLRSEIASYLPAVFIFSSCRTRGDATRNGGVPWLSLLSDRWHPAGSSSNGSQASCRQSLSFLPATRQPMPPGRRSRPRPSHPTGCQCVGRWWLSMHMPYKNMTCGINYKQ